jgi:acetyl esterase/lipase
MTSPDASARAARRRGDLLPQPLPVSALAEDRVVAGVPVRVFTPADVEGVYLHVHGGGFVYGSARLQDDRLEKLAHACRAAVISVEYRLAPEHPYPAAPDDCEAVAAWLAGSATAQFGTGQLAIGGESAGAGLAVTTLVRLRDRHGFTGFQAAALAFGTYDLELSTFAETGDPALRRDELDQLFTDYAGTASRADPDLSPIHADLRDLPGALFVVGALDPLLHDSRRMCERWRDAGNAALFKIWPDSPHGVDVSSDVRSFLATHLGS